MRRQQFKENPAVDILPVALCVQALSFPLVHTLTIKNGLLLHGGNQVSTATRALIPDIS
jgi:hypothetical protein